MPNGQLPSGNVPGKVRESFAYIMCHREHAVSRHRLGEILWPDKSSCQTKKYIRHVFWQLNKLWPKELADLHGMLFTAEGDWISVNSDCPYELDLQHFEQVCYELLNVLPENISDAQIPSLAEAWQR